MENRFCLRFLFILKKYWNTDSKWTIIFGNMHKGCLKIDAIPRIIQCNLSGGEFGPTWFWTSPSLHFWNNVPHMALFLVRHIKNRYFPYFSHIPSCPDPHSPLREATLLQVALYYSGNSIYFQTPFMHVTKIIVHLESVFQYFFSMNRNLRQNLSRFIDINIYLVFYTKRLNNSTWKDKQLITIKH